MVNTHSIMGEKVIAQSPEALELEVLISGESDFFKGHFPQFQLLPAVAQFEVVTRFSQKYFHTQRYVPSIKRIKFSSPIFPNTLVKLSLKRNVAKGTMAFSLVDAKDAQKVYSSGTFSTVDE